MIAKGQKGRGQKIVIEAEEIGIKDEHEDENDYYGQDEYADGNGYNAEVKTEQEDRKPFSANENGGGDQ